jgi:hypothetical protein
MQQQHVALIGIQLGQQLGNAGALCASPVTCRAPSRADRQLGERIQRTTFGAPLIPQQVRRDPEQPRQSINVIAKRGPALERNRKRPSRDVIRAVTPKTPGEISVNLVEMPVEQHRKRLRPLQGLLDDRRVRLLPTQARLDPHAFLLSSEAQKFP